MGGLIGGLIAIDLGVGFILMSRPIDIGGRGGPIGLLCNCGLLTIYQSILQHNVLGSPILLLDIGLALHLIYSHALVFF